MLAITLFLFGYALNMFTISVLYHRSLAHTSVTLSPLATFMLKHFGVWITGLDPVAWAAMHRLHHQHSDQKADPHSPTHQGVMGVWKGQYLAYRSITEGLMKGDEKLKRVVRDLPFGISRIQYLNLSTLPYVIHALIGVGLWLTLDSFWCGAGYFLGIMSHPIQGWMVNALAHSYGGRNFETPDDSRNNLWVAWLVFGEGLQNNHHAHPNRANFSFKWHEPDMGYVLCRLAQIFRFLKIN